MNYTLSDSTMIFPNNHVKNRLNNTVEGFYPSPVELSIQKFNRLFITKPIINNSFHQAKRLGLITRFDNQLYLSNYYDFACFNLTTLVFCVFSYRYMYSKGKINPKTRAEALGVAISMFFFSEVLSIVIFYKRMMKTLSFLDRKYTPIIHKYNEEKHRFTC